MFSLENDRQDYGRLLVPPIGYEVEMAVGTTYSLDLEALIFTAIALGLGGDTDPIDSTLGNNPISLLNALRKVTDRVVLFYESGHLHIPLDSKNNKLFQLFEKITVPVALPALSQNKNNSRTGNTGIYPSFHPKTWLLCYRHIETRELKYRFIVMSRNLTFDRSWDVVVSFEGEKTYTRQEISEPISRFLHFLKNQTLTDESKKIVETLRKDVLEVKFDIGGFSGVEFMPIGCKYKGYNGYDIDSDLWLGEGEDITPFHEVVIMSPFISKGIISRFNDEKRRLRTNSPCERTLITRFSELEKLDSASAGNFKIYTVKDEVIDGETEISEDSSVSTNTSNSNTYQQDIHAKVLMFARRGMPSCLYLGSMNASHNGFYRNVEFNVCLWCNNSLFRPSSFLEDIGINSPHSPFQQRDLSEKVTSEKGNKTIDIALKRICRSNAHGRVIKSVGSREVNGNRNENEEESKDENYTVQLHFDQDMITPGMTIQPITGKYPQLTIEYVTEFANIPLMDITEYYRIFIPDQDGEVHTCIIQIPLECIPMERDRMICNQVIENKNRLYEYISLILSDDKVQTILEFKDILHGDSKFQNKLIQTPAIYEKLLEASLHHRHRFREINDIIQMLPKDSEIVTEFNKLYLTFRKALNLKDNE